MARDLYWKVRCNKKTPVEIRPGDAYMQPCRYTEEFETDHYGSRTEDRLIDEAEAAGWSYEWDAEKREEVWLCPKHAKEKVNG